MRWRARGSWPLGVLVALCLCLAPRARAADEAEQQDEELRRSLVSVTTVGEWQGQLVEILKQPGGRVGSILGPLFTGEAYASRGDLVAYVAAFLADNPVSGFGGRKEVLLQDSILRRCRGDEAFVGRMRGTMRVLPQIRRQPGWDLLFDHARASLAADAGTLEDRGAAVEFLGREAGGREEEALIAVAVEARRILAQGASSDPFTKAAAARDRKAVEPAVLAALDALVIYRFRSLEDAAQYLDASQRLAYVEKVKDLSRRKDKATEDKDNAVAYGRALIAKAESPKDLLERLDPALTPYPELRLEAIRRAARLKPAPAEDWVPLFRLAFGEGTEEAVVREAVKILDAAELNKEPKAAEPVAVTVAARLARRGGDPTDLRVLLARVLGDLENHQSLVQALSTAAGDGSGVEVEVLAELIRSAGKAERAEVDDVLHFYRADGGDPARTLALREAVVEALGRSGMKASDGAAAARALRWILSGGGDLPRAEAASVRRLALDKLEKYPGPETADVLADLAEGPDAEEAKTAIRVLGQILRRQHEERDAPRRLAALAHLADLAEDRRSDALRQLQDLSSGAPADVRAEVVAVLHELLLPGATASLRRPAARTAAALGDGSALEVVFGSWKAEPSSAEWTSVLTDLVKNAAARGPEDDDAVARTLSAVAQEGKLPLALDLARAVAGAAPSRAPLQAALAGILYDRAQSSPGDPASGNALKEADEILKRTVPSLAAGNEQEAGRGLWVGVLAALAKAAGETPEGKARLLDAVRAAVKSKDALVLQQGLELGKSLETEPLKSLLTDDERSELTDLLQRMRAALQR